MESWHGDCRERESEGITVWLIYRHTNENEGTEQRVKQEKEAQQMSYI